VVLLAADLAAEEQKSGREAGLWGSQEGGPVGGEEVRN